MRSPLPLTDTSKDSLPSGMVYLLYDILLHASVIILLPYFLVKMLTARKYREGIPERFGFVGASKLKGLGSRAVWVHAVSVGETKAVMPVLRMLKRRRPDVKIVFSTVTATGQRTAAQDGQGLIDSLIYFPLDLSWAVRRVASRVRPALFISVEKEFWPNAFRTMRAIGAPVVIVNGTISERSSRRFKRLSFIFRDVFGGITMFLARTPEDARRAEEAGVRIDRVEAAGNLKFDLSPPVMDRQFVENLKSVAGVAPGARLLVAGSTHPGEEEIVISAYKALAEEFKGLKLVIAPRHPERFPEVDAILKRSGLRYARRSKGGGADVLLLDSIGELMTMYSLADIAFVGGSIVPGIGGHNLLEPAFFGKPVVYGPYLTTYSGMAEKLEEEGGGLRAADPAALAEAVRRLLSNELLMKRAGANARKVVEANRGASERTVAAIERLLKR